MARSSSGNTSHGVGHVFSVAVLASGVAEVELSQVTFQELDTDIEVGAIE
jgi:hypothetical protein